MTRLVSIVIALTVAAPAWADDPTPPPPTKDQLDAAKKAFDEAQVLYGAGKYHDAIGKLEASYRLSRNVFLLYNIGHAYDQLGDKPKALAFYLEFLETASATAPKRDETTKRVDELKQASVEPDLEVTEALNKPPEKPVSKFQADFHHQPVDSVPPGKPIDIVVQAPREANWTVTLFYRSADEADYTSQPMTWRDQVLVGQVPGAKVAGNSMQYYIEVKDADGTLVTRSGKRTSPNLVKIEERTVVAPKLHDDPLLQVDHPHRPPRKLITPVTVSTAAAVVLIGGTVVTYLVAKQKGDDLRFDSTACGAPPCQVFDAGFDRPLESSGRRYNRIYQVTLGATVAAVGIAGYFWVRDLRGKPRDKMATRAHHAWAVAASLGDGFSGAIAGRQF